MKRKTGPPKETIKVEVTEEDIECGLRKNGLSCPVALAIRSHMDHVMVLCKTAVVWKGRYDSRKELKLPPEATKFIARFDETGEGDPFSFELEV